MASPKSLLILLPFLVAANAHREVLPRQVHQLHARQAASSALAAPAPSNPPGASAPSGTSSSILAAVTLTATDSNIPPLSAITSGMSTGPSSALPTTVALGAPGPFPNFPPLPSTTLNIASYPTPTGTVVPIEPTQVAEWLKELEGHQIPDIPPTKDGGCSANPEAMADASRCWWTCGGCTRPSDVFTCPDKGTWGLTFDDGPSPETPKLLNFLNQNKLKTTFAVVGGSNYFFSDVLRAEYALGHHIIVHTYRHPYMTTLTTPQVVAELGYTRKIIKDTIGVTPAFWRPPYGDVDDRIRAIAFAMGFDTILWTRNPQTMEQFDTNDWRIPAGQVTGPQAFQQFTNILANASMLNTGFIVLEHDLYPETVDLAVGYTLPAALRHQPPFKIVPVIDCLKLQPSDAYIETMGNKVRSPPTSNWGGGFITNPVSLLNSSSSDGSPSGPGASGQSSGGKNAASSVTPSAFGASLLMGASVLLGVFAVV